MTLIAIRHQHETRQLIDPGNPLPDVEEVGQRNS
jgi:hypothetical protein